MTKINLGSFYGYDINLEIPTKEYKKQPKDADEFYKSQFIKLIKTPQIKDKKWWQKLW